MTTSHRRHNSHRLALTAGAQRVSPCRVCGCLHTADAPPSGSVEAAATGITPVVFVTSLTLADGLHTVHTDRLTATSHAGDGWDMSKPTRCRGGLRVSTQSRVSTGGVGQDIGRIRLRLVVHHPHLTRRCPVVRPARLVWTAVHGMVARRRLHQAWVGGCAHVLASPTQHVRQDELVLASTPTHAVRVAGV